MLGAEGLKLCLGPKAPESGYEHLTRTNSGINRAVVTKLGRRLVDEKMIFTRFFEDLGIPPPLLS